MRKSLLSKESYCCCQIAKDGRFGFHFIYICFFRVLVFCGCLFACYHLLRCILHIISRCTVFMFLRGLRVGCSPPIVYNLLLLPQAEETYV